LQVAVDELQTDSYCTDDIKLLFEMFDNDEEGIVTSKTLRHVLQEVECADALSEHEYLEFMHFIGLPADAELLGSLVNEDDAELFGSLGVIRVEELLAELVVGFPLRAL
jgi:Ca2+-binding EF-hand superfamily protein